jgi:hypothetical protein
MFAAAALTGILSGKWASLPHKKPEQAFAAIAFLMADAMLAAREEKTKS